MKMFNDSHLEVKKFFKGTFFTHPYEACLLYTSDAADEL